MKIQVQTLPLHIDFTNVKITAGDFQAGDIGRLPIVDYGVETETIRGLVSSNIDESTTDWDSSEVSWDFKRHPLV